MYKTKKGSKLHQSPIKLLWWPSYRIKVWAQIWYVDNPKNTIKSSIWLVHSLQCTWDDKKSKNILTNLIPKLIVNIFLYESGGSWISGKVGIKLGCTWSDGDWETYARIQCKDFWCLLVALKKPTNRQNKLLTEYFSTSSRIHY